MRTIRSFLALALILTTSICYAQPPAGNDKGGHNGPPPIPSEKQIEQMVDHLAKEISLSKAQEEKVLELYIAHFEQVKIKTSGNYRPNREEMETLKMAFEKDIEAELTDEQKVRFDEFLKEHRKKRI